MRDLSLRTTRLVLCSIEAPDTPSPPVRVGVEHGGELVGRLDIDLDTTGRVASLSGTIDAAHRNRGYATEAAGAVVDALLAAEVHRIDACVDPADLASKRVLEHVGFVREGTARQSVLRNGQWSDEERWALLATDRAEWLARPTGPATEVRLVPIEPDAARAFAALRTDPTQERFVASMCSSYADALFPDVDEAGGRLVPWLRGVEADGEPAGFVMVAEPTATNPQPYLWRLLVDRRHQGRGIGRRVVQQLADRYRAAGATELLTSWVPEHGGPEGFYLGLGFALTGEVDDGEVVGRLVL